MTEPLTTRARMSGARDTRARMSGARDTQSCGVVAGNPSHPGGYGLPRHAEEELKEMEGTRRDVEQNCQGEGALIANRRDGGEFRDERKRSKPWALCAEWSPVSCRRRVGGRRNAGQEGAARKRHEESSRRTAPWPGGTQQRSKSRSELPDGHRMGTQRKVSAAVEAMSSADVHGMARHDGAPRAWPCRVTRRNGRSRDRNRRTGT